MFSKTLIRYLNQKGTGSMMPKGINMAGVIGGIPKRAIYRPGHEPAVFINKDTKVIC